MLPFARKDSKALICFTALIFMERRRPIDEWKTIRENQFKNDYKSHMAVTCYQAVNVIELIRVVQLRYPHRSDYLIMLSNELRKS